MEKYIISVRVEEIGYNLHCVGDPGILLRWFLHDSTSYQVDSTNLHTDLKRGDLQPFINKYFNPDVIELKYV